MLKEFREFAIKGNVIDLAVGVIIGAAFAKIVSSLVDDILMPLLGLILGRVDFSGLMVKVGDAEVKYGLFLQNVVQFLLVALAVFLLIKQINRMKRAPAQETTPDLRDCPFCATSISVKAVRCPACTSEVGAA